MRIEDIESPEFLKELDKDQLNNLAYDIREFLIESLSKTGGHLSSNLGVVELTIALHKVFDSPKDQIFFDVGHQCYIHKILTGRANDFKTLRQFKGLSGFVKSTESAHDVWESGHASTSISGALGYSKAKQHFNCDDKTIVVIGDGSVGGGMSFEALNHLGEIGKNVVVILNDNGMSISKPVGGLSKTFSKVRISSKYVNSKNRVKRILRKLPKGVSILSYFKGLRSKLKNKYFEEGKFFEGLGLKYYGPIDGHNIEDLLDVLEFAKNVSDPVVIHVKTQKGKGYSFAEQDTKGAWHGVSKFDVETGKSLSSLEFGFENWSNIIIWTIEKLAVTNEDLVVVTPAMENGSMLKKFKSKFPTRYFDVGIAEEHATTMCAGLSLGGLHPFLTIYSTFLQRSYDQLIHDICRMDTKVIIGIDRSGIVGADGETHQGVYDVAFLKTIPNITICMPRNAVDAQHLLSTCIKYEHPIAIRYPRGSVEYTPVSAYKEYEIGKWEKVMTGSEDLIITYGTHVDGLSEYIGSNNLDVGVVNARFIHPIDTDMLKELCVQYTNIYVYEEVIENNNLYTEIIKFVYENELKTNVTSFCFPNSFIEHGSVEEIYKMYELDYPTICNKICKR